MPKKKVKKAVVASNRRVAADHFVIDVHAPYLAKSSKPGQFVMVKVSEKTTDPLLRIPLGVHEIGRKRISLLYKVVGTATEILSSRRDGTEVDILGPLGNGFDTRISRGADGPALLLGGGHGAAPLYALAKELLLKKKKVEVFLGAGTAAHIVCASQLKKRGARVHLATEDGTRGFKGYVTDLFRERLAKAKRTDPDRCSLYACGPRPMLACLYSIINGKISRAQVSLDAYMACGIGACLGCAVRTRAGYKMVCKDGPVFDIDEIDWKREGA